MTRSSTVPADADRPSVQLCGVVLAMLALQAVLLTYYSRALVAPIAVLATATWTFFGNARTLDRSGATRIALALALVFAAMYRVAPPSLRTSSVFISSQLAYAIAQYVLCVQAIWLLTWRRYAQIPPFMPWLATIGMLCLADVRVTDIERGWFQLAVLIFLVLLACYTGMSRPITVPAGTGDSGYRSVAVGAALLMVVSVGWWTATLLKGHERDLEDLISNYLQPPDGARTRGFSGGGRLDSVTRRRSTDDDHVALRVYSESEPRYLRGRVFVSYRHHQWQSRTSDVSLLPSASLRTTLDPDSRVFPVAAGRSFKANELTAMECWPDPAGDGTVFTPLHTAYFVADVDRIRRSKDAVIQADDLPVGYPYEALTAISAAGRLTNPRDRETLLVPLRFDDSQRRAVEEKAREIFHGCSTDRDRFQAVTRYFHKNYQYSEETITPSAADPIGWFLLEASSGHCEFFASAATCLLRMSGIPARYVTGFRVTERNRFGGYWVARNRDAHAWVEAFDRDNGWMVVEATPPSGLPDIQQGTRAMHLLEYLRDGVQTFRIRFAQGGFRWLLAGVFDLLRSSGPFAWIAVLAWSAVLALRFHQRRRQRTAAGTVSLEMERLLNQMNKACRKLKLERSHAETLHRFAERIEERSVTHESAREIAEWYRLFATVRYGGRRSAATIEELRRTAV